MAPRSSATVLGLVEPAGAGGESGVVRRLAELGFLPGEIVTVLRRGPGGREPIAVQIGETVFALRSLEASCIQVQSCVVAGQP
ncbi:MAG: FeoA family protein [Rhodoferax sp.]|uniref:FeoA family protein n=1 Tax=Rhodoferax sp. TaxID=50421 RepID=UPI00271655C6|nr:FeoA family protein [Rhodoferax sp.]MDO8450628.1 FeoA family protein [Rhodoferax sp.]